MKVMLLLSNELKQRYVIRELMKTHEVCCAIIEDRYTAVSRIKSFLTANSYNFFKIIKNIVVKFKIKRYETRDAKIISSFFYEGGKPIELDNNVKIYYVADVNDQRVIDMIGECVPDIIAVFGTSMLREPFLRNVKQRIINVHTGLSPYYRGGQAAFWALYNREPEYIGVTVHYISKGIDSGDIIIQGRPDINSADNLCAIECKLAITAARLLSKAISLIERNADKRVKQVSKGKLFLSKMFTLDKRMELEKMMEDGLINNYLAKKEAALKNIKIVDDNYSENSI